MYGVLGQQVRDGDSPTFFNPQEAEVVARLVNSLIQENLEAKCECVSLRNSDNTACTVSRCALESAVSPE